MELALSIRDGAYVRIWGPYDNIRTALPIRCPYVPLKPSSNRYWKTIKPRPELSGLGSGFTKDDRDMAVSIICGRWNDAHNAVHAAGYLLDPENIRTNVTEKQETR